MHRTSFLIGMLSGLLVGVVVLTAQQVGTTRPAAAPASVIAKPALVVPPNCRAVPHGWHEFEFNGVPCYIIPLG
jgi:hypothetical protein